MANASSGSARGRSRAVLSALLLTVTLALALSACGVRSRVATSVTPLSEGQVEELASFQCVTAQTAAQVRDSFRPEDAAYTRAALLYQQTRDAFNPIIEGIARDVERDATVDGAGYWARLEQAEAQQAELVAHAESAEGFGFIGLGTLAAIATPYAKKLVRNFVDQKLRDYAADYLRDELLLPPYDQVEQTCPEVAEEA